MFHTRNRFDQVLEDGFFSGFDVHRCNHARNNRHRFAVFVFQGVVFGLDENTVIDLVRVEFQTCRSGGKGGQHVNKTESAVRATHKESGISVRVESERSQHANKKLAVMLLAQKLAEHHAGQAGNFAQELHAQLYQVERGNPKRTFVGAIFKEK